MTSTTRRPSRAVYRRRRLVLLVGVLVVAALVWVLIAQPWRGWAATGPDAASTPSGSSSPTTAPTPASSPTTKPDADSATAAEDEAADEEEDDAEPSPEATPAVTACTPSALEVVAKTDKDSYGSGENPKLSITLTNHSGVDCTLNVGTTAQTFEISSGSDVWWRSTDCQSKPSDMVVTLAAGQTVSSAKPLTWDRTRSSVDSCDSESRPQAPGGGASYHLSVSIGGVSSTASAQFLLY